MTCHQARQQLAAYRRDDWTAAELRQLAEHLENCAACRQVEAMYRRVGESIRQLPSIIPDAAFRESVFAAIAAERQKLGPAAMLASRAETQPALPVVRAPITPLRRRTPTPVMRAAVAIAAASAIPCSLLTMSVTLRAVSALTTCLPFEVDCAAIASTCFM